MPTSSAVSTTAAHSRQLALPPELREKLEESAELVSIVYACLDRVTPILRRNETFFFPEYTDHGIEHVGQVIHTAWSLALPEARRRMTAQDCACLVLSAVLHDFAMHIGRQGFASLARGETPHRSVPWFASQFDEKTWQVLWNEFTSEAARWDAQRCIRVYGDSEPLQMPKLDALRDHDWSLNERMVAGEFIRRHHGRMAHEFALYGFPAGADGAVVTLSNRASSLDFDHIADLSGLIAHSHSLPLRKSLEYLRSEPRYWRNVRNPYDCHAPFLMTLLRIADYIQIQADRAPAGPIKLVDSLHSPISLREWKTHLAIRQMSHEHDDPECIEVVMHPPDVETYLNSRRLLDGLQQELDQSWAVLGEVYQAARQESERLFPAGLTLRRIRSNLDDLKLFSKTVGYVPRLAQFTVVAPQIVNLLAEPLYGANPQIAVRELTQNAVDAVFELRDIRTMSPDSIIAGGETYDLGGHDVRIEIETDADGTRWLVCTDTGRGMTEDVIIDYFLSIGSSFRMSPAWRKTHAAEADAPRFARSGRFGVGVLAAFLLGDELECTTRSYSRPIGLTFTATPRMEIVELRHVEAPIGTHIRVKLGANIPDGFVPQRWYFGHECHVHIEANKSKPQDGRRFDDDGDDAAPKWIASQAKTPPTSDWRRLPQTEYPAVDWCPVGTHAGLFCNGILISRDHRYELSLEPDADRRYSWEKPPYRFLTAYADNISFIDHHGRLPLKLDRMELSDKLPLKDELAVDYIDNVLALWMIAMSVRNLVQHVPARSERSSIRQFFPRPASSDRSMEMLSATGVRPWDAFASQLPPGSLLLREFHVENDIDDITDGLINDERFLHCHEVEYGSSLARTADWIWEIVCDRDSPNAWPRSRSAWIALGSRWPTDKLLSTMRKFMLRRHLGNEQIGSLNVFKFGPDPIPPVARAMLLERCEHDTSLTRLGVCLLDPTRPPAKPGRLARRWQQLIGAEIPFDHDARRRLIEECRRDVRFAWHLDFWEANKSRLPDILSA